MNVNRILSNLDGNLIIYLSSVWITFQFRSTNWAHKCVIGKCNRYFYECIGIANYFSKRSKINYYCFTVNECCHVVDSYYIIIHKRTTNVFLRLVYYYNHNNICVITVKT